MTDARVAVRKTGNSLFPWEARCTACRKWHTHLFPDVGAVAVNTRGVGNRTWALAMVAGLSHLLRCHEPTASAQERPGGGA